MFHCNIVNVRESGRLFVAMTYSHSVVDALALLNWHRDLDQLIYNNDASIPEKTPYKLFANLFQEYQDSLSGQRSVAYHAQRLRGISRLKRALFPKQRAPGWMISNDTDSEHAVQRQEVRTKIWKGQWELRAQEFRYPRLGRVVCLPKLKKLLEQHGIRPSLFAQCAIAMLNVIQTKSSHALFNSWESGRSWPFVPGWIEAVAPSDEY